MVALKSSVLDSPGDSAVRQGKEIQGRRKHPQLVLSGKASLKNVSGEHSSWPHLFHI